MLFAIPAFAADKSIAEHAEEAKAKAVIQKFVSAWNAHKIDDLTHLFTSDGSFKSPAGEGARTRSAIRKLLAREHRDIFRQSTLATSVANVTLPKAGVADVTGTYTLSGIPAVLGIDVSRQGTFDFRMTRRSGRWLISSARIAKA